MPNSSFPCAQAALLSVGAMVLASASLAQPSITGMGIPNATNPGVIPLGISGDGSTAFGWGRFPPSADFRPQSGFAWTTVFGYRQNALNQVNASSFDGSILVGPASFVFGGTPFAAIWTSGERTILDDVPTTGSFGSTAVAVSHDGAVIVGTASPASSSIKAFRRRNGQVELLDARTSTARTDATGVSADGSRVVGYESTIIGVRAALWEDDGTWRDLGALPGGNGRSSALAISADGSTVVGGSQSTPGYEAFLWTDKDGMVGLGDLDGGSYESVANDVSANGAVIVGVGNTDLGREAAVWFNGGEARLLSSVLEGLGVSLDGWQRLTEAVGVSEDGLTIVGSGVRLDGRTESFIAVIPAPGAASMLTLAAGFAMRRRR